MLEVDRNFMGNIINNIKTPSRSPQEVIKLLQCWNRKLQLKLNKNLGPKLDDESSEVSSFLDPPFGEKRKKPAETAESYEEKRRKLSDENSNATSIVDANLCNNRNIPHVQRGFAVLGVQDCVSFVYYPDFATEIVFPLETVVGIRQHLVTLMI